MLRRFRKKRKLSGDQRYAIGHVNDHLQDDAGRDARQQIFNKDDDQRCNDDRQFDPWKMKFRHQQAPASSMSPMTSPPYWCTTSDDL
jgi:hypothetical protein